MLARSTGTVNPESEAVATVTGGGGAPALRMGRARRDGGAPAPEDERVRRRRAQPRVAASPVRPGGEIRAGAPSFIRVQYITIGNDGAVSLCCTRTVHSIFAGRPVPSPSGC